MAIRLTGKPMKVAPAHGAEGVEFTVEGKGALKDGSLVVKGDGVLFATGKLNGSDARTEIAFTRADDGDDPYVVAGLVALGDEPEDD